jgi:hypothetical protein
MRYHLILPIGLLFFMVSCKKNEADPESHETKCHFSVISAARTFHVTYLGERVKNMKNEEEYYRYDYDDSGKISRVRRTAMNDTFTVNRTADYTYDNAGRVIKIIFRNFASGSEQNQQVEDWSWSGGKLSDINLFIDSTSMYHYSFVWSGNNIYQVNYTTPNGLFPMVLDYDTVKNPFYNNYKELPYLLRTQYTVQPHLFINEYIPKGYHYPNNSTLYPYFYTLDSKGNISSFSYFPSVPNYIFGYDCN